MTRYLAIDGVAERYATSKDSVYRWIRNGRDFPVPIVLPSGLKRWAICELDQWDSTHRACPDDLA